MTKCCGRVVGTLALYSRGPGFKSLETGYPEIFHSFSQFRQANPKKVP